MELLLELLLTMALSVLIAFLLGKIVSVASPEGDDPDSRGAAEEDVAPSSRRVRFSDVSAPVVSVEEAGGKAEAVRQVAVGLHAEAAEGGCGEADDGRRDEQIAHQEEEGEEEEEEEVAAAEGVVRGSEEARGKELRLEEAAGGEKVHAAPLEQTEEDSASEATEVIGRVIRDLAIEEKLLPAEDAGRVVDAALSLYEEREIAKELGAGEVGVESVKDGERVGGMVETDDVKVVPHGMATEVGLESGDGRPETIVKNEKGGSSMFNEDDDWEGIEKSDLDKLFAAATAFAGSDEGSEALAKMSSDLQMQLYGLHKVATEGPCYESQPMSLKVSARAKWHAWQRLGNMNPDMAMEQYITLVSDNIPDWMPQKNRANDFPTEREGNSPDKGISGSVVAFSSSQPEDQLFQKNERNLESHSYTGECDVPVVSEDTEQGETGLMDSKNGSSEFMNMLREVQL